MFPAVFNLANLNGKNGFVIKGIPMSYGYSYSGSSVSDAGDINGDCIGDVIVGAWGALNVTGQSYVVFGSRKPFPSLVNASALNGKNGFIINGINPNDYGGKVSKAGDINADGIDDLITCAAHANNYTGQCYVIFGSRTPFASPFNLNNLNGQNGFIVNGISPGDVCGSSISNAGDFNFDGIDDIIIGAPQSNNLGIGQAYIIFGNKNGFSSPFNLSSLNGKNGLIINGISQGDWLGSSVSSAGDVNGDWIPDVIIGATQQGSGAGKAYVVFGSQNGFSSPFNLSNLNGHNGFALKGINPGDLCGYTVSGAGDVNGDWISDVIIGAHVANNHTGQSYVVYGSKEAFTPEIDLSSLNGTSGFVINGINAGDASGNSVSNGWNINGDWISDIIIGASWANNAAGQIYVIFGNKNGFSSPFNLSSLNGKNGFTIDGNLPGSFGGYSISGASSINGDWTTDIIIGAPNNAGLSGQSYVLFPDEIT